MSTINMIFISGLTTICVFGFLYLIVCLSMLFNRRNGFKMLNRTKTNTPKGKPTIPPKEGWDDINIPMR